MFKFHDATQVPLYVQRGEGKHSNRSYYPPRWCKHLDDPCVCQKEGCGRRTVKDRTKFDAVQAACDISLAPVDNPFGYCYQAGVFQLLYHTRLWEFLTDSIQTMIRRAIKMGLADPEDCYRLPLPLRKLYRLWTHTLLEVDPDEEDLSLMDSGGDANILLLAICKMCPELSRRMFVVDFPRNNGDGEQGTPVPVSSMLSDFTGKLLPGTRSPGTAPYVLATLDVTFPVGCSTTDVYRILQTALERVPEIRGGLLSYKQRDDDGTTDGHCISFTTCKNDYLFRQAGSTKRLSDMVRMTREEAVAYTGHIQEAWAVYVMKKRPLVVAMSAME
jgi:hypothetical protein